MNICNDFMNIRFIVPEINAVHSRRRFDRNRVTSNNPGI